MSIKHDLILSDLVKQYTLEYGNYILDELFPHYIDGLKIVQRRALWVAKEHYPNFTSSMDIVSSTGKYHEHNPDSIYSAIVRLAQSFSVLYPLFELKGDVGSYSGDSPAAYRYTKLRISDFAYDVYFKKLHTSLLSFKPSDNIDLLEPKFLIPAIPISLILYNKCIGFGFHSSTLSYTLEMMKILIDVYFQHKDKINWNHKHQQQLLQMTLNNEICFTAPITNNLLHHNTKEYTLEGSYTLIDKKKLVIYNLPYGIPFSSVKEKLLKLLKTTDFISDIKSSSNDKNTAKYIIDFKNRPDIYINMLKVLKTLGICKTYQYHLNYSKDGFMIPIHNPFVLVDFWYKCRKNYTINSLNLQISILKQRKLELESQLLVIEHPELRDIILNSNDDDESRYKIVKALKEDNIIITRAQAEHILNTKIKVLNSVNSKKVKKGIEECKEKIKSLSETLQSNDDVDQLILNNVYNIVNKYKRTQYISKRPTYIGYIVVNDEMSIFIEDEKELKRLLKNFKRSITYIKLFHSKDEIHNIRYGHTFTSTKPIYGLPCKMSSNIFYSKSSSYYTLKLLRYKSKLLKNKLEKYNPIRLDDNITTDKQFIITYDRNKLRLGISNGISDVPSNVLFVKSIPKYYKYPGKILVVYWMSDQPQKLRYVYVDLQNHSWKDKPYIDLPFRFNTTLYVLDIIVEPNSPLININRDDRYEPLLLHVNDELREVFNSKSVILINTKQIIKYLEKKNLYSDIHFTNMNFRLK